MHSIEVPQDMDMGRRLEVFWIDKAARADMRVLKPLLEANMQSVLADFDGNWRDRPELRHLFQDRQLVDYV